MKYKSYEYHGYFLAYYIEDSSEITSTNIYVLLGKKNFFNRYLHNNPGQYVIPGGRCNFNKTNEILREFQEETGHKPKRNDFNIIEVTSIKYRDKVYSTLYEVSKEEYEEFKDLNLEMRDWNERELSSLKWFNLKEAFELMNSGQICTDEEIRNVSKQFLTRRRFLSWYKYNKKTFLTDEEITNLIKFKDKEKIIFNKYFKELKKDIYAKSYVDWYIHILNHLENRLIKN